MKFNEMGLSKPLLESLTAMGFAVPTPIQEQAIPLLLQGKDLIGQAQTGTGKTAAFGLPILEAWLRSPKASNQPAHHLGANAPAHHQAGHHDAAQHSNAHPSNEHLAQHVSRSGAQYNSRGPAAHPNSVDRRSSSNYGVASPTALILVPTRELAVQVHQSLQSMAGRTGACVVPVYGGQEMRKQLRAFQSPLDILVGTPGRTLDHLRQGSLRLDQVRVVVLDEADRMLDMGFIHDVTMILEQTPRARQTMLFSATMPGAVSNIAHKYMKSPHTIKVSEEQLTVKLTKQLYVRVSDSNRLGMLLAAIRTLKPYLSVVFCRTKHGAKKLARQLNQSGIKADALHGNLRQNARERTMAQFRDGKMDVLVATDLASRGLDVLGITHVFNYDMPDDPMTYVHRIGRTGRAGAEGTAVSLILGNPYRPVEIIQDATGSKMEELVLTADVVSLTPSEVSDFEDGDSNRHFGSERRSGSGRHMDSGRHSGQGRHFDPERHSDGNRHSSVRSHEGDGEFGRPARHDSGRPSHGRHGGGSFGHEGEGASGHGGGFARGSHGGDFGTSHSGGHGGVRSAHSGGHGDANSSHSRGGRPPLRAQHHSSHRRH